MWALCLGVFLKVKVYAIKAHNIEELKANVRAEIGAYKFEILVGYWNCIKKGTLWESPDLFPLELFLWGSLKGKVYANKTQNLDKLKANVRAEIT